MSVLKFNSTLSDEQLVVQCKKGESDAMGVLYERYYNKVFAKCLSYTMSATESFDLTQEIMLKVFTKIHNFKCDSKFSTWLFVISQNHCLDFLRKRKKLRTISMEDNIDLADEVVDYQYHLEKEEVFRNVKSCLDDVSFVDKEMLLMKYEQNISIKELQEFYQIGPSAVKMRLKRARNKVLGAYKLKRSAA